MARYIDADKAIEYLKKHKRMCLERNVVLRADEDDVIKFIDTKCPTEDVAEVKHGHWIEKVDWDSCYYECSACGNEWICIEGTPLDNDMNFCPHCGAKMDEEEEE